MSVSPQSLHCSVFLLRALARVNNVLEVGIAMTAYPRGAKFPDVPG